MNLIPPQISLRFFLIALSKNIKDLQILFAKRGEKVFGKSEIRQNCLTRKYFQHFYRFRSLRRRAAPLHKPCPIALIRSRVLNLHRRALRTLFDTIGGFLDQKSVATFGISCRDSISQNSISSHGIELNLSGLSRYIKYSAKQSFLTSQTCSKVDFSMNQY